MPHSVAKKKPQNNLACVKRPFFKKQPFLFFFKSQQIIIYHVFIQSLICARQYSKYLRNNNSIKSSYPPWEEGVIMY